MHRKASMLGMLALLLCLAAPAWGQEQRGALEGTIRDAQGAVLLVSRSKPAAQHLSACERWRPTRPGSTGFLRFRPATT